MDIANGQKITKFKWFYSSRDVNQEGERKWQKFGIIRNCNTKSFFFQVINAYSPSQKSRQFPIFHGMNSDDDLGMDVMYLHCKQ